MPQDNYALMADHTRRLFLTYDQAAILEKIPMNADPDYFYFPVLDRTCRIDRHTGHFFWSSPEGWLPGTSPNDPITIFDYLCDSRPDRRLSGEFQALASFGHMFHTGLQENAPPTRLEQFIDAHPEQFREACLRLGGTPYPKGDIGFTLPLFPDLPVLVQFWHSDEDFPPQLRPFWDRNSLQWIRYETMYYAWGMILDRLSAIVFSSN